MDTRLVPVLTALGITLSEAQLAQFEAFEEALYRHNEVKNLTRVPREDAWLRHTVDSLLFHDLIPEGSAVIDLGTGPGFPSWPLACARPDLHVTALDSNGKMLEFLRAQRLPNMTVIHSRAEEWGHREKFDVVTGRALAPLAVQLELSAPMAKVGGRVLPLRMPGDDFDAVRLSKMGLVLRDVVTRNLPDTDIGRAVPVYEKVVPTDRSLPRRWAEIKANPLIFRG